MSMTFNSLSAQSYRDLFSQMMKFFEGIESYAYNDSKKIQQLVLASRSVRTRNIF